MFQPTVAAHRRALPPVRDSHPSRSPEEVQRQVGKRRTAAARLQHRPWRAESAWALVPALLSLLLGACKSDKPAPEQAPAAAATPPPAPSPPPPPPPPPDEPDEPEKPEEEPEAAKPPARKVPRGCSDPCRGKETMELLSSLRGRAGQARSCYERALSQNSSLQGRLGVGVRIGATGRACSVKIVDDGLGDASVNRCVLKRFRAGKYPKPEGGCLDTKVPIAFVPRN